MSIKSHVLKAEAAAFMRQSRKSVRLKGAGRSTVLSKNINVLKDKGCGYIPDYRKLKRQENCVTPGPRLTSLLEDE